MCFVCVYYPYDMSSFVGLAYQGKDIVFGFIIEYSSLMDFGPQVVGLFLYEDFQRMIFWLVLKLEIRYRVMISWRILVPFRGFFLRLYFCMMKYLNFHNSSFALRYFLPQMTRPQCDTPLDGLGFSWCLLMLFHCFLRVHPWASKEEENKREKGKTKHTQKLLQVGTNSTSSIVSSVHSEMAGWGFFLFF